MEIQNGGPALVHVPTVSIIHVRVLYLGSILTLIEGVGEFILFWNVCLNIICSDGRSSSEYYGACDVDIPEGCYVDRVYWFSACSMTLGSIIMLTCFLLIAGVRKENVTMLLTYQIIMHFIGIAYFIYGILIIAGDEVNTGYGIWFIFFAIFIELLTLVVHSYRKKIKGAYAHGRATTFLPQPAPSGVNHAPPSPFSAVGNYSSPDVGGAYSTPATNFAPATNSVPATYFVPAANSAPATYPAPSSNHVPGN